MINKKKIIITMLLLSLFQMSMVALAPVIASITNAFPGTSQTSAQLVMTFLCLVSTLLALVSGPISHRIGRRAMCVLGMILCSAAGFCGVFLSLYLPLLFLWSVLIGSGIGLFVPAISSMMVDYFDEKERNKVAGIQSTFVNIGGMALTFLSGMLAAFRWNYAYLVFLFAIPVAFLSMKTLPKEEAPQSSEQKKAAPIPSLVWVAALQTFVFGVFYFCFSTNISLLLEERGIGSTSLSGTATSVFMCGGCVFGLLFPKLSSITKKCTPAFACLMVALSDFIICNTSGIPALLIAAFIGGGSLSIIFPYLLMGIAGKVDPSVSVISSSLIVSVAPNLGSFLSPMILTTLSNGIWGTVEGRFMLSWICMVLVAVIMLLGVFHPIRVRCCRNKFK